MYNQLHLVYERDPASIQDTASIIELTANTPINYMTPASIWAGAHNEKERLMLNTAREPTFRKKST